MYIAEQGARVIICWQIRKEFMIHIAHLSMSSLYEEAVFRKKVSWKRKLLLASSVHTLQQLHMYLKGTFSHSEPHPRPFSSGPEVGI